MEAFSHTPPEEENNPEIPVLKTGVQVVVFSDLKKDFLTGMGDEAKRPMKPSEATEAINVFLEQIVKQGGRVLGVINADLFSEDSDTDSPWHMSMQTTTVIFFLVEKD